MSAVKPYHLKLCLSNRYATAQVIRMADGHIVAAASSMEKALRESLHNGVDKVNFVDRFRGQLILLAKVVRQMFSFVCSFRDSVFVVSTAIMWHSWAPSG
jgi:hypothetical protein